VGNGGTLFPRNAPKSTSEDNDAVGLTVHVQKKSLENLFSGHLVRPTLVHIAKSIFYVTILAEPNKSYSEKQRGSGRVASHEYLSLWDECSSSSLHKEVE